MRFLNEDISRDRGASMVEYGLLVAVIALVSLSAVTLLGDKTDETFTTIAGSLEDDGSAQAPGNSEPGDENGGDENGGDENGGDENGGDENGGDENGGDENGRDENGGDENGGDENGGDENGGDENVGTDQQGQQDENDADDESDNGGSNDDANDGDQDDVEEEEEAQLAGPTATGTSAALYWWDSNATKGQWKADVSYRNDTDRHQYLTLEVTQIDDKGNATKTTVTGFYVGAGGSSTYTVWSNDINENNKKVKGVVEVQVKVLSVRTSDEEWQTYSYDVDGSPASILPPELP